MRSLHRVAGVVVCLAAGVAGVAGAAWAQGARHRPPCSASERLEAGWCYGSVAPRNPTPRVSRPRCSGGRVLVDGECDCPVRRPVFDASLGRCVASAPSPGVASVPNAPSAQGGCSEGMVRVAGRSREGVRYDLCFDRTEVTVAAYRACVNVGACTAAGTTVQWPGVTAEQVRDFSPFCNAVRNGVDDHPVNCVDASQADAYCGWRGGRLPTEQEWQFAAQGPEGRTHPWGEAVPSSQLCWNRWESRAGTCAVGSFPAGRSPFGLDDMSGNVWEWTSSTESTNRVFRGGGWLFTGPAWVRAADRFWNAPSNRDCHLGFRCARGAP